MKTNSSSHWRNNENEKTKNEINALSIMSQIYNNLYHAHAGTAMAWNQVASELFNLFGHVLVPGEIVCS